MDFNTLITEVYNLTNRPDLVNETKSAVKAATLKAHHSDFYSKDIYETGIQFETPGYIKSLDYPSLISNFRALKYIRRVTDANDDFGTFIEVLTPDALLDSYGCNKSDVAYVAGRIIEIRSAVQFDKILLGCYVSPLVGDATYNSWVAELFPFTIVYEAARVVFKTIGYDEQSAQYERLTAEQFAMLKMSALADVGY